MSNSSKSPRASEIRFKNRVISTALSSEFLRQFGDFETEAEIYARMIDAAERLEGSYSVVAEVEQNEGFGDGSYNYTLRVIPSVNAEFDAVRMGMESIQTWVLEADNE